MFKRIKRYDPDKRWLKHSLKITFASSLAMLYWHFNQDVNTIWTVLAATFLMAMPVGKSRGQRLWSIPVQGGVVALIVAITSGLATHFWVGLGWLFGLMLVIFAIPYFSPPRYTAGLFVGTLAIVSLNFPAGWAPGWSYAMAVLSAIPIVLLIEFFCWPDKTRHPWAAGSRDPQVLLRALRVSLAVVVGVLLTTALGLENYSWTALTIFVVTQTNLGASIRRGWDRLSGTLIGVGVGLGLAHSLMVDLPFVKYIAPVLIFGMWYPSLFYYGVSSFFVTLLVIDVYYFLPSPHSINTYILLRLLDTALGVSVALAMELMFFRQSARTKVRQHMYDFWNHLSNLFERWLTSEKLNPSEISERLAGIDQDHRAMQSAFTDLAFEPFRFSRRYRFTIKLMRAQREVCQTAQHLFGAEEFPNLIRNRPVLLKLLQATTRLLGDPDKPISTEDPAAVWFYQTLEQLSRQLYAQLKLLRGCQGEAERLLYTLVFLIRRCLLVLQYYFKPIAPASQTLSTPLIHGVQRDA